MLIVYQLSLTQILIIINKNACCVLFQKKYFIYLNEDICFFAIYVLFTCFITCIFASVTESVCMLGVLCSSNLILSNINAESRIFVQCNALGSLENDFGFKYILCII